MDQRVSLFTLGVHDLARSRAFYEGLGWKTGAEPDDDVVFFQCGGMVVALWDRARLAADSAVEDGGGWGGVTFAYNVASPQEVDAAIEEARAAGARAIVLETAERLVEANRLYTRLGFLPVQGEAAGSFARLSEQCDLAYRLELG